MAEMYFAARPVEEIGAHLTKKLSSYHELLASSGKLLLWRRAYEAFHKGSIKLGTLTKSGDHNEYTILNVNHYRSLLDRICMMTTQQRPALDPRAVNTDTQSIAQTKLAQGLLDYYMRDKGVESYIKEAVQFCLNYGEGFITAEWDPNHGESYGVSPETGTEVKQGDLEFKAFMPHFVARDIAKGDSDQDWYIVTRYKNKYDLMAMYPDLAEKINRQQYLTDEAYQVFYTYNLSALWLHEETDLIPIHTFYHKRCPAVPQGRMTMFVGADCVLFDGPLPYRSMPIMRIVPSNEDLSCFGYTVGYDLLPMQEIIDGLYTAAATNLSTFSVQNVMCPRGFDISVESLTGGLNLIEYDKSLGKPEPLNLLLTAGEVYTAIQNIQREMETISGVNSVARGNPESSLKSGNALALVQSMAIQANSGLQQSYTRLLEQIGTQIIEVLQDYATVPRVAMIAGKMQRPYMKEFSGQDINLIRRVIVDVGNPLSKTLSGKTQMAENYMQLGFIKTPEQYTQVVNTGQLDVMYEADQMELYNIRYENEIMMEGEQPVVAITDSHSLHIKEHRSVLASPESRKDPRIVTAVTQHIQEHINTLMTANPNVLMMLGQQPIQQQQMPAPQGGQPPQGQTAETLNAQNPVTQEAGEVNMPTPPKNALTNESWNPVTGGLPNLGG